VKPGPVILHSAKVFAASRQDPRHSTFTSAETEQQL